MPETTSSSDKRARQRLLKKMREVWIEGVLEPSLHNTTRCTSLPETRRVNLLRHD